MQIAELIVVERCVCLKLCVPPGLLTNLGTHMESSRSKPQRSIAFHFRVHFQLGFNLVPRSCAYHSGKYHSGKEMDKGGCSET